MKKGLKVEEAGGFYSESSGSPKRSGVASSDVFWYLCLVSVFGICATHSAKNHIKIKWPPT